MGTLFVDNIKHQSSQGTGTITVGASGEKVDLGTGVSGGTLTNTPNFGARSTSGVTAATGTFTKITFNIEQWDVGSAFDLSNSKFVVPSGFAGKYWFQATTELGLIDDAEYGQIVFYKNGSSEPGTTARWYSPGTNKDVRVRSQVFLNLSAGDEIEAYIQHNEGGTRTLSTSETFFKGYRLISE
jgi:hypothetical protein